LIAVTVTSVLIGTQFRRSRITVDALENLQLVAELNRDATEIVWSPDRQRIAVIGWEQPVELLDSKTLNVLETFGEGKGIIHFAFGHNDDVVAYCSNNYEAQILNRRTKQLFTLPAKNHQPKMVFSPDGKLLATGGYGTTVSLWSTRDGTFVTELDVGENEGGLTPRFSPDGRLLAVGNRNSRTHVFNVSTGQLRAILPNVSSHELAFDPQGGRLAVTYVDASLRIWNVADWSLIAEHQTPAEELYSVDWSPDGAMLVTSGRGGAVTLWDPDKLVILRELPAPEWVIDVRFSPDGMNLLYSGGDESFAKRANRTIQVWGIEGKLYTWLNRSRE
jgi:WD40 repeat protein